MNLLSSDIYSAKWGPKPGEEYMARLNNWVYICAEKNATFMASANIRLYRKGRGKKLSPKSVKSLVAARGKSMYVTDSDEAQEVTNSPGLDLLRTPNDNESGAEATWLRFFAKQGCGNAFQYFTDDQKLTLRPQYMTVIPSRGDRIIWGWRYGRESTAERDIPAEEIGHFMHRPSLRSPFWGDGPTYACYQHSDLMTNALTSEASRWKNDGRSPAVAMLPKEMTPDQVTAAIAEMRKQVRGVKNNGNWLYGQVVDVKVLGFAPKDMEYLAGQQVSERTIWAAFGIPESIIRPNEGALAAAEAAMRFYNETTIWPQLCLDADQLTAIDRKWGLIAENEFYAYDAVTQEDEAAQAAILKTHIDSGVRTLNEARAALGLDPYPDEFTGDTPRIMGIPIAHAPTADAAITKGETPALPGQVAPAGGETVQDTALNGAQSQSLRETAADVAAGKLPVETGIAIARVSNPGVSDEHLEAIFSPLRNFTPKPDPEPAAAKSETPAGKSRRPLHTKDDDDDYKRAKLEAAAKMQADIEGWLKGVAQNVASGSVEITAAQYAQLETIVRTNLAEAYSKAVNIQLPGDMPPMTPDAAIARLQDEGSMIIERITARTTNDLRTVVTNGLQEGKTYKEIADDIEDSGYPEFRARAIARTETANATSMGRMDGMRQAGVTTKTWYLGGNPCAICEFIAAKMVKAGGSIPIDQPFLTAGEFPGVTQNIMYPPAHPNCVCDFAGGSNG